MSKQTAKGKRQRWLYVLPAGLYVLLAQVFEKPERYLLTLSACLLLFLIVEFWRLRSERWFWLFLGAVGIGHFYLIFGANVGWSESISALAVGHFAEAMLLCLIIDQIDRFLDRRARSKA